MNPRAARPAFILRVICDGMPGGGGAFFSAGGSSGGRGGVSGASVADSESCGSGLGSDPRSGSDFGLGLRLGLWALGSGLGCGLGSLTWVPVRPR